MMGKILYILPALLLVLAGCSENRIEPPVRDDGVLEISGIRYGKLDFELDGRHLPDSDSLGISIFAEGNRLGDGHILRREGLKYRLLHGEAIHLFDGDFKIIHRAAEGGRRHGFILDLRLSRGHVREVSVENHYKNFENGDGSAASPYEVDNINGSKNSLVALSMAVQKDPEHGKGIHFRQVGDLDFSTYEYIVTQSVIGCCAGAESSEFRGVYDGAANGGEAGRILNYEISRFPYAGAGFFHALGDGAAVRNLEFRNAKISGKEPFVGTLAGYTSSGKVKIENVSVSNSDIKGVSYVGGLIGRVGSDIEMKECWIDGSSYVGSVEGAEGVENIGGLLGACEGIGSGIIEKCYTDKSVDVVGMDNVGAFVGMINISAHLSMKDIRNYSNNIYAYGNNCGGIAGEVILGGGGVLSIEGGEHPDPGTEYDYPQLQAESALGGLVGSCSMSEGSSISLKGIDMSGNHKCAGMYYGGLIGRVTGAGELEITDCRHLANGLVIAEGGCAGGFMGAAEEAAVRISGSANLASIRTEAENIAGMIGYVNNGNVTIEDSFNSGFIMGREDVGGLIGDLRWSDADIISSCGSGDLEGKTDDTQILGSKEGGCVGGMVAYAEESTLNIYGSGIAAKGFIGSGERACIYTGGLVGFSYMSALTVKGNLELRCTVTGNAYVGGALGAGLTYSVYDNERPCIDISGLSVMANGISGYQDVGGIVGYAEGRYCSIRNCTVLEGVKIYSEHIHAGGMAGYIDLWKGDKVLVKDCTNHASVHAYSSAGGMIGRLEGDATNADAVMEDCRNYGKIDGVRTIGGIVGYIAERCDYPYLRRIVNYGEVSNENNAYPPEDVCIGGIVGHARA